mgnify:FL=1
MEAVHRFSQLDGSIYNLFAIYSVPDICNDLSPSLVSIPTKPCFKYVKFNTLATFAEAEQVCSDNGGNLPFFKGPTEYNEFKKDLYATEWIGFNLKLKALNMCWGVRRENNTWVNADGSCAFLKWRHNEPNNFDGMETCVEFYPYRPIGMNDIDCNSTRHIFRCRIDIDQEVRLFWAKLHKNFL